MEDFFFDVLEFVKKPAIIETFVDIILCSVPIWLAVVIGLLIGWSWRPRWTGLVFLGLRPKLRFVWTFPPGFGARRLWLACTALSAFSVASRLWSNFRLSRRKSSGVEKVVSGSDLGELSEPGGGEIRLINGTSTKEHDLVTKNDLEHLLHLLDGKGWDKPWQYLMDRSTSNMAYQAWHHEPEINDRCFAGKPSDQKRMTADFWNEANKLADLHHPNVVAFYGVPQNGPSGSLATVTDYMVNGSLRTVLQENDKNLDMGNRLLIAKDDCMERK